MDNVYTELSLELLQPQPLELLLGGGSFIVLRSRGGRKSDIDSNNSIHDTYCKKSKTMPDFAAVKELVKQHVDSYICSGASLVQALTILLPLLKLQALRI